MCTRLHHSYTHIQLLVVIIAAKVFAAQCVFHVMAALVCSGTTRLLLDNLVKEWKDPGFSVSGMQQSRQCMLSWLL